MSTLARQARATYAPKNAQIILSSDKFVNKMGQIEQLRNWDFLREKTPFANKKDIYMKNPY
ncbi:MAG: hypothetical protein Phog2KO_11040 [Phototrophicaceae bacterium]